MSGDVEPRAVQRRERTDMRERCDSSAGLPEPATTLMQCTPASGCASSQGSSRSSASASACRWSRGSPSPASG
jgi:hypothetical protein